MGTTEDFLLNLLFFSYTLLHTCSIDTSFQAFSGVSLHISKSVIAKMNSSDFHKDLKPNKKAHAPFSALVQMPGEVLWKEAFVGGEVLVLAPVRFLHSHQPACILVRF